MFRLLTHVTASPTASARISSARAATAATSRPRAPNSVTSSATPGSWPRRTPASTSPTGPAGPRPARQQAGRVHIRPRVPLRGAPAHQDDLGAVTDIPVLADLLREDRARIVAAQARAASLRSSDREAHAGVEPRVGLLGELGVDGQPRRQVEAPLLGHRLQASDGRPGPLRVDVIGRDG